jgi:UMF1 family MFS transporter
MSAITTSIEGDAAATPTDRRGAISWALVEFARNPYVSLIFMFVFAPYFAATVVGDPVRGQQLWSLSYTIAGVCIAIFAPILGAIVDRMGSRKPWNIASVVIMAPACWALWYAMPGTHGGLPLALVCALVIILMIAFESGAVAHNAMLPSLASGPALGRLSGYGLGAGAIGSLCAQVIVLFTVVLPATPGVEWSFLPSDPWFGLDPALFEHARVVGPVAGVWMAVFIIPFALWTPDLPATGVRAGRAIREGFRQLRITVSHARKVSNVGLFLAARMLYNDGMIAVQAYCGIYAAGVFGWDLATIMIFALILSACCVLGGFLGGWLDGRLGSRGAILLSLALTCFAVIIAVSVTPQQIFFLPYDAAAHDPLWSFPYFRTIPELIYLAMYMVLAVTITAIIVNSRAMMARVAPLSMMSQFFGLYALSGTATAFLGHGMVALFTSLFHSQRVGFASLILLLGAGWLLTRLVNEERAPELM